MVDAKDLVGQTIELTKSYTLVSEDGLKRHEVILIRFTSGKIVCFVAGEEYDVEEHHSFLQIMNPDEMDSFEDDRTLRFVSSSWK